MRRRDLINAIQQAAAAAGVDWEKIRDGARHEIWRCGDEQISIPRHRQINSRTAQGIMKQLESVLGERWWR